MSKKAADKAAPAEAAYPGVDPDMQAHSDLRTMIEHAKIHADKPRLKRAMAKHKEMMTALQQAAAASQAVQAAPPPGAPGASPMGPAANGGAY